MAKNKLYADGPSYRCCKRSQPNAQSSERPAGPSVMLIVDASLTRRLMISHSRASENIYFRAVQIIPYSEGAMVNWL